MKRSLLRTKGPAQKQVEKHTPTPNHVHGQLSSMDKQAEIEISPWQKRSEWLQSQIRNFKGGAPPPRYCTLSFSSGSHKQDTKAVALLFIVHRGRSALSWTGRIRYVLLLGERRWTSAASRQTKTAFKTLLCCWKRWFIKDFKCHLQQVNAATWLENVLKVVYITSPQTHLVQSVHCVQRGCGPLQDHVAQCLSFSSKGQAFSPLLPAPPSSLHFSLGNVPCPLGTDVEKYN